MSKPLPCRCDAPNPECCRAGRPMIGRLWEMCRGVNCPADQTEKWQARWDAKNGGRACTPAEAERAKKDGPSLARKALNLARAVVRRVRRGGRTATKDEYEARMAMCKGCEFFAQDPGRNPTCSKCGCALNRKLWWTSERCPVGKWLEITPPREVPVLKLSDPPPKGSSHVVVFYLSAPQRGETLHIGLGVNAMHTEVALRRADIACDHFNAYDLDDYERLLSGSSVTHVVFQALWAPWDKLEGLARKFSRVRFVLRCHSQVTFIHAAGMELFRRAATAGLPNLAVAANSERFAAFVRAAYGVPCLYLPNLYDLDHPRAEPTSQRPGVLRVGAFGAVRTLKNLPTAAAAALLIARARGAMLNFHVNSGRTENGDGVRQFLAQLFRGLEWARLIDVPWQPWPEFRRTVAGMDLCLQPSFTETFCLTAADACAEAVPVVGSPAIDWLPDDWKADPDDPADVARVGLRLLADPAAGEVGRAALRAHVRAAAATWFDWLGR